MQYDFKELKTKAGEAQEWLKKELMSIQTGRATTAALDSIKVDSYGAKVQIQQVASINTEDARTLRIVPYNDDDILSVERAITDADLGLGVGSDDKGVRVTFPELTGETRAKYIKMAHKKLEEARISLRATRDEVWNKIQKMEKDGDIGKDDKFRFKDEMEKLAKQADEALAGLAERKEQELSG